MIRRFLRALRSRETAPEAPSSWTGPFRQPEHDRVELTVAEDGVFMQYMHEAHV